MLWNVVARMFHVSQVYLKNYKTLYTMCSRKYATYGEKLDAIGFTEKFILDKNCCAEQRTYEKFYGLLAQRFCQINKTYIEPFQQIFKDTYGTTHRLDANRLRNVSKFFAHLLFTDAISWEVLEIMKMNEEDTNSSSRIFIKILFQELAEYMGLGKLNARLKDPTLQGHFAGLFPRDNPKNTRFSINFFTSIGLGGLTDELREHLKNVPKNLPVANKEDASSSSSSSSSSSDEDSSSESSDSSEDETSKRKKKINKPRSTHDREKPRDDRQKKPRELVSDKEERGRREKKDRQGEKSRNAPDYNDNRKKRDYEWVKSRYEDNISQLKDRRKAFDDSRSRRKDRVKDEKGRGTRATEKVRIKDENEEEQDGCYRDKRNRDRQRS